MKILTKNTDLLKREVRRHIEADAVIQGRYWKPSDNEVRGTGCFIGCLAHDNEPVIILEKYGLPIDVIRLCEYVFEKLPADKSVDFFSSIPEAVFCDNKDLSMVSWRFLSEFAKQVANEPIYRQNKIGVLIDCVDSLIRGEDYDLELVRELTETLQLSRISKREDARAHEVRMRREGVDEIDIIRHDPVRESLDAEIGALSALIFICSALKDHSGLTSNYYSYALSHLWYSHYNLRVLSEAFNKNQADPVIGHSNLILKLIKEAPVYSPKIINPEV